MGEIHWGGYAQKARVKSDWLVNCPQGSAPEKRHGGRHRGFTAMQGIVALEDHGLTLAKTRSGAGRYGRCRLCRLAILANLGYKVAGVTGKADQADYLKGLGATDIIDA